VGEERKKNKKNFKKRPLNASRGWEQEKEWKTKNKEGREKPNQDGGNMIFALSGKGITSKETCTNQPLGYKGGKKQKRK